MKQQYDSYKPSGIDWIGDIPSHWVSKRLRYVCEFRNGYTPSKANGEYWADGTIPWYRMEDIREFGRFLKESKQSISKDAVKGCGLFEAGSFILATTATIGEHAMLIVDSLANQQFTNLKIRKSLNHTVTKEFFFYYLFVIDEFCKSTTKTTTFPAMDMTDLRNFGVSIPPLAEQEAIAAWLDEKCGEIDAAIAKVDREIELIDELKQSEISRVVTRGLNPNASLRPSGIDWIGNIPSHWEIAPVKYSFNLFAGATPKTEKAIYWDGEIIWITPADYKTDDHYISKGRKNITKEGLASCATEIVPINSLIFSKRAPIGTVSLAKTPLCTNQGCISCVPKSATNSNFFYYSCRIATKEFEMLGSGATFLEISSSNFANFKMPLPPLTEQQAIADYLDKKCAEIDGLKAKLSKKRETLKELRQSIISEVVTGKRKVI
ncbi:MAG: restriction endonuclease subunit S [Prevotella sp.]|jgi:type I restriction enzyme S subunit|uniref:restriction endonuclease subunit S n=1 Tax=Muribaculum intestinale TaxID=1796646 RepID=UPI000F49FF04|nr:restriction endonuclease subunit S [Muribaculum intestinale]MCX4294445.1 restriction endonuclease subunit S [Prevotella sp.]ROT17623.1 restriction endonuclease subunit S [Muribaculaceae bacterium Isolate-110 (HZI)]